MRTHISTRRCEATDAMRAQAAELAERLGAEEPRIVLAKYMFEASGERRTVAAVLGIPDEDSLVAHAEAKEWPDAVRELERRLRRQLQERREEQDSPPSQEGGSS